MSLAYTLYFEKRNIIEMHGNGQKNRVYMIEDGQLVMIKKDLNISIDNIING